jgi:hypothetical protein
VGGEAFHNILSRLADHSCNEFDAAKLVIELDRCAFVAEQDPTYLLAYTKLDPIEASPKNDIIVGVQYRPCSVLL